MPFKKLGSAILRSRPTRLCCVLLFLMTIGAKAAPSIIPLPALMENRPGTFTLGPCQILADAPSQETARYLALELSKSTGFEFKVGLSTAPAAQPGAILITTAAAAADVGSEGYELTVATDSVVIRASAQAGAFYGAQSFLQLLPPQIYSARVVGGVPWTAPCAYVKDFPQFHWRGIMLDEARHFYGKACVKQVLDAMAMQKLNVFHWHLVDDQGWRLEINNYPRLTAVGAWRKGIDYGLAARSTTAYDAQGRYGGFYTQADAREIVAYAAERHITVVPEIEFPCHATAALASYPEFGCGNPAGDYNMDYPHIHYRVDLYSLAPPSIKFFEDVLSQVIAIFPGEYIHCGGDEVMDCGDHQWNSWPPDVKNMKEHGLEPGGAIALVRYQHWLSGTLADYLHSKGRTMMGWTEIENAGIVPNAALMDWESGSPSKAIPAAEAGRPVVTAYNNQCYVNYLEGENSNCLPHEPPMFIGGEPRYLSVRRVYLFNPIPARLAPPFWKNILGAQCNLWTEYVPSARDVMLRIFPRETAMAEVTWTPRRLQNYGSFQARLAVEKERFDQMNLNYDHESIPSIGKWGPAVSTSPLTVNLNISSRVAGPGELDVNFWRTGGSDSLAIESVALLQNGVVVDTDRHEGLAGRRPSEPMYIVHLSSFKPGSTYAIQARLAGKLSKNAAPSQTAATTGTIYLPNWN